MFENYFASRPADYKERIFALLGAWARPFRADVELGYHLCYGSPADQHLVMPRDTASSPSSATRSLRALPGAVDFLHLPVPRERDDAAYFTPLRELRLPATRLYLGLIHQDDADGDRRRIDTARDAVGRGFGVATECGWGRGEPARLDGLLESHRRAVDYLLAGAAR